MSKTDIALFYDKVQKDENLQDKMKDIENSTMARISSITREKAERELIPIAQENNMIFDYDELLEYKNSLLKNVDENILQDVSGGYTFCFAAGGGDLCGCFMGGYGKGGCFCPMFGSGK